MPGFLVYIGKKDLNFAPETRSKLVINHTCGKDYQVESRVVNKFMNDRIFVDTDNYLVVVEGIVLNNHDLMKQYQMDTWKDCVIRMYEIVGDAFFETFRGSFSGVLYDKRQDKWLIYTDHIGEKQVFVSKTPNGYLFASEMRFIVETRKANRLSCTLDETGAYFTITHGFCIEDLTLVQEVRKLTAGQYFCLHGDKLEQLTYYRFTNQPNNQMTQEEAVEGIDKFFRQAIKRAFEKDREYGYKHFACLSGGLDSRMTVWVAHKMGYTKQLNITFSESGYLDFSIAQQIAIDLHHDWLFKPLDGGNCIELLEEATRITYGAANSFNLCHGKSMEDLINYEPFGIIHTGQIGDSVVGTFFTKLDYIKEVKVGQAAYSQEIIERLANYHFQQQYDNEEMFCLYSRAFTGANQGLLTFQENSESYSPFTDVDFLCFCYTIPLELRFNHKIYFDWILTKYPEAANYIWEKTRSYIRPFTNTKPRIMNVFGYEVPCFTDPNFGSYLHGFIRRRLGLQKKGEKAATVTMLTKDNMNPIDYWYNTNPAFRDFIQEYWKRYEHLLPNNQFGADMRHLFYDCVLYEKLQALTVLSAIKLLNE